MSAVSEPVVPGVIASRYRVLRELGRGGMGAVYLVEHVHTGEQFALKVLLAHCGASPDIVERFKRESRAPARIKSDHVAKVIDADVAPELDGAPFLVMELLDGSNLEQHIEASGPLSIEETLGILRQLAIALDKAHAIGIVHRDLKPENIFLHRREGQRVVKLLDFGISKLTDEGGGDIRHASLTKTGAMMGTPLYMSPEQARGETKIGPATDIWALGLIAFRMLTTATYWDAPTIAVLMSQILALPMPPASARARVPSSFDAWFARACDRDPSRRFGSVSEQVEALAAAFADPGARASLVGTGLPITHAPPRPFQGATTPMPPARPSAPFGAGTSVGMVYTNLGPITAAPRASRAPWVIGASGVVLAVLAVGAALFARSAHKTLASGDPDASSLTGMVAAAPETASASASASALGLGEVVPSAIASSTPPPEAAPPPAPSPSPLTPATEKSPRATKHAAAAGAVGHAPEAASSASPATPAAPSPVARPAPQARPAAPVTTFAPTAL